MLKKSLPTVEPLISCYPQHAFYMSIISEKEECLPWIFSNYTNLFIDENGFCDFFVKTPEYYLYPWFQGSQRFHRDFLINHEIKLLEFIEENIIQGNYIWLHIDEFYLPCSAQFEKKHFIHSVLISGFDNLKRMFTIHGYYNKEKYSTKHVHYSDLERSFYNANPEIDFKFYIHLVKYNVHYSLLNFTYNTSLLKEQLVCHLNSEFKPLLDLEEAYNLNSAKNITNGLNVYNKIIELYNSELENSKTKFNDHRSLYTLLEHKRFMLLKLEYLKKKKILVFSNEVFEKYEEILKSIENQLILYIKYSMTKNRDIVKRIIKSLAIIREEEKKILILMLSEF